LVLKQAIQEKHVDHPRPETQKLIFSGRILTDSIVLVDLFKHVDISFPQTFHLIIRKETLNNNNFAQPSPQHRVFQQQPYGQPGYLNYQQQQHQQQNQYPGNVNNIQNNFNNQPFPGGQFVNQFGQPFVQGNNNRVHVARIEVNVSLILKLFVLVLILGQGGSSGRFIFLALVSLIFYIYQVRRGNNNNNNNNNEGENIPRNENNNNNNNQNEQQRELPFYIAPNQGIVGEIMTFVVPFVLSLFPSWEPPRIPHQNNNQQQPQQNNQQPQQDNQQPQQDNQQPQPNNQPQNPDIFNIGN